MAAPAYSKHLWGDAALSIGTHSSGAVPAGKVWVVRDIEVLPPATFGAPVQGFTVSDPANEPIWALIFPNLLPNKSYHWRGRQVFNEGEYLVANIRDAGTGIRVSGYELTA